MRSTRLATLRPLTLLRYLTTLSLLSLLTTTTGLFWESCIDCLICLETTYIFPLSFLYLIVVIDIPVAFYNPMKLSLNYSEFAFLRCLWCTIHSRYWHLYSYNRFPLMVW
jgi:hypothetical protein